MTRDRKGPRARGGLSEEDVDLWQHTASSVTRSLRIKGRVHPALSDDGRAEMATPRPHLRHETRIVDHKSGAAGDAHAPPPHPAPRAQAGKAPSLADFDRKKARKLGAGQLDIEARIDLHGMRQSEAHAALRRFIATSHARGARWVLVITGKGAPAGSREYSDRPWSGDEMGREDRGVLRRNVPRWLAEPDLRMLVVSFTAASVRHGGDGALYVHLRNPERVRR